MTSLLTALPLSLALLAAGAPVQAQRPELLIGVRIDAKPFVWKDAGTGHYKGFLWQLCLQAATRAGYQVDTRDISASDRAGLLEQPNDQNNAPQIDLLCDPVSLTMSRLGRLTVQSETYHPTPIVFVATSSYFPSARAQSTGAPRPAGRPVEGGGNDSQCQPQAGVGPPDEAARPWQRITSRIRLWPAPPASGPEFWGAVSGTTSSAPGQLDIALKNRAAQGKDPAACGVLYSSHSEAAEDFCRGVLTRYYGDIDIVRAAIHDASARMDGQCDPKNLTVPKDGQAYEPYVLLSKPGASAKINHAVYSMFSDGTMAALLKTHFPNMAPSQALEWLLVINRLPQGEAPEPEPATEP